MYRLLAFSFRQSFEDLIVNISMLVLFYRNHTDVLFLIVMMSIDKLSLSKYIFNSLAFIQCEAKDLEILPFKRPDPSIYF